METTETLVHEAERRAELLTARYAALTQGNPGFHYHCHMSGCEDGIPDSESVTAALVAGRDRFADLMRLAADDRTFQLWRLRLEHPRWWIGGRVRGTTPLLDDLVSELSDTAPEGGTGPNGLIFSFHLGATGYVGAHWFTCAREAIAPLTDPARAKLGEALGRELLGRNLCNNALALLLGDQVDVAETFPEAEFGAVVDSAGLKDAIDGAEAIHGPQWALAFRTMLGELDRLTWAAVTHALITEIQGAR